MLSFQQAILSCFIIVVTIIWFIFYRSKPSHDSNDDVNFFGKDGGKGNDKEQGIFVGEIQIPIERQLYIDAKSRLDDNTDPANISELKKLLMRRAIASIPYIVKLQEEGDSVERLYKKGMLTDDMYSKVKDLKSFVDLEYNEVKKEAEALAEGWADQIWSQARRFQLIIVAKKNGTSGHDDDDDNDNKFNIDDYNNNNAASSSKNKKKGSSNKFDVNKYANLSAEEKAERIGKELIEEEANDKNKKNKNNNNKNKTRKE